MFSKLHRDPRHILWVFLQSEDGATDLATDFPAQSGSKPRPKTNYVTPPLWTQSGAATGWCLMITMVGNGLRRSRNNATAQLYHAWECYRAPFQRLLGYGPCPRRGVGQGLAILYFALLLLVPVIITPAVLSRWYPLFSQPLGIPKVCPLQGMFLCILLKSHSSFRLS